MQEKIANKLNNPKLILLIIILILSYLGILQSLLDLVVYPISIANVSYIKTIEEISIKNLVEISGLFSTISILKTSSAGFSFIFDLEIQYGNLLNSLYILLEKAWHYSFLSLTVIELMKLTLKVSYFILPFLVNLYLTFLFFSYIFQNFKYKKQIDGIKNISLYFVIVAYLAIPLFVNFTSILSQNISQPMKQKMHSEIAKLKDHLPNKDYKSLKDHSKKLVKNTSKSYKDTSSTIEKFAKILANHISTSIIVAIIIPISFIFYMMLLYKILRKKIFTELKEDFNKYQES